MIRDLFPLLQKELHEQAAHKKTYLIRSVFGFVLFALFLAIWHRYTNAAVAQSSLTGIGKGKEILDYIVNLEFMAIFVLVPVLSGGTIAGERERNNLDFLLISALHPWEILLQKLIASVIPMVTLLLMGLPLMALAYALGGVSLQYLYEIICSLFVCLLQMAAITMFFSCCCRNTTQAILVTYILCIPLFAITEVTGTPLMFFQKSWGEQPSPWLYVATIPIFLAMARIFLTAPPVYSNHSWRLVLEKFIRDNFSVYRWLKQRDIAPILAIRPIAWRELKQGQKQLPPSLYLVVVAIPLIALNLYSLHQLTSLCNILYFSLVTVAIAIEASSLFVGERQRQTLAVLFTTPLHTRDILQQKMERLQQNRTIFIGSLLILVLAKAHRIDLEHSSHFYQALVYLVHALICIFFCLPTVQWAMVWLGLKLQAGTRSVSIAIIALLAWIFVPFLMFLAMADTTQNPGIVALITTIFSPLALFSHAELNIGSLNQRYFLTVITAMLYTISLLALRELCLRRCSIYLQRLE